MDAVNALGFFVPPAVVEERKADPVRQAIDWSLFDFERLPGWAYEDGIAGFRHFGVDGRFNELSPYVKATREMDNGLMAGIGRTVNSEGADSIFAGVGGDLGPMWWELGGATGYEAAPVVPFGRLGMDLPGDMSVWAMPAYDGERLGGVIGLNFLNRRF